MSQNRILVAASSGIASDRWLARKLAEVIPSPNDVTISEIGRNKNLSEALRKIGAEPMTLECSLPIRKSEIRRALDNTDFVLFFWDGRTMTNLLFESRLRSMPMKVFAIEVTEIVNKEHTDDYEAYIGRGTPWGNPYQVGKQEGQLDRSEAIEKYKIHFSEKILGDESTRRGLLGLRGMRLACHCKPFACHGDVISDYLNSLDPDEVS
jgi:hypothetical protein